MSTEKNSSLFYGRLEAERLAREVALPLRSGAGALFGDEIVAELRLSADGLAFIADALEAQYPTDGMTGEIRALRRRVSELMWEPSP